MCASHARSLPLLISISVCFSLPSVYFEVIIFALENGFNFAEIMQIGVVQIRINQKLKRAPAEHATS